MVKRSGGYEDNWDDFMRKINHYSPNQRRALREEITIDFKLAMIHGIARDWLKPRNREDAINRVRQAQSRMVEERRMAINPAARRVHLDDATRAMLPPIRIHRTANEERRKAQQARYAFWKGIEQGTWRGRAIEQIVERARSGGRLWAAGHPYGPAVEPERIAALTADLRRWRAGRIELT
ncbi:MAG: hypothetical protein ABUL47_01995, partial [Leifsonia sp.]